MTLSADLWDRCLAQLRLQMSKATFETWLQNTTAREEEGRLIVLTPSSFAQDCLDNRLRDTIERAVSFVAEQSVAVEFRLTTNGSYQPDLFFTGMYRDAYNAIVQPDKQHYCSRYFHQKWLPLLGPQLWLLIWEMRTRCSWDWKTGEVRRDVVEATAQELAQMIGISKATF
jgi:chromosomal replication initiation ATPase DnaA